MEINDLPIEAFVCILRKTNGITLGRCRRVCKKWNEVIDSNDLLWQDACRKEYKHSSKIAKRKCGTDCSWYHIYKNLTMWITIATAEKNVREFYKFSLHDKCHALAVESSILPLKDTRGILLYDMSCLKYIPVVVPERNCFKISNSSNATVVLLKSGLSLERTVKSESFMSEAFFKADKFVLSDEFLYFFNNRDVYKCDLSVESLSAKLILHCDFDIKEIEFNNGIVYLFTDCGKIVKIEGENITVKPINCPAEWVKQIKHISVINDKNFVCYSRSLFKIETDRYQHLYLDFPPITALFFYGEVVLIGTKSGEILLYRLSSQKRATKPIFEKLADLPDGKFAVQLDVCERRTGPIIIVATFFEILIIEVNFFPQDYAGATSATSKTFTADKLIMYKRLLKLKNRLQCNY